MNQELLLVRIILIYPPIRIEGYVNPHLKKVVKY